MPAATRAQLGDSGTSGPFDETWMSAKSTPGVRAIPEEGRSVAEIMVECAMNVEPSHSVSGAEVMVAVNTAEVKPEVSGSFRAFGV